MALHRRALRLGQARGRPAERRHASTGGKIHDIGDHRRGGRSPARARPDQRQSHRIGIDRDRVEHAVDSGDDGPARHHGRMHALLDAGFGALRDAEQLHPVAEFIGGFEIGERDLFDPLDMHRLGIDLGAEGEAGQDRDLVRGIEAADVEGRIGLRIAEPLRLLQAGGERQALVEHAGEDVVAGAVEDAVDARDAAAAQPLAQRLDDRNAAGDRRLERERGVLRFSASFASATPCLASSALLAVTTGPADAERRLDRGSWPDRPPRP